MSKVLEPGECDCACHKNEGVFHVMPCCDNCPHCDKRIRNGWMDSHLQSCPNKKV